MRGCSRRRKPTGPGIGAVTNSGGERELIVDLASDLGAPLAELTPPTHAERLTAVLDPGMTPVNPVNSYGDGRTLLEDSLTIIADDPNGSASSRSRPTWCMGDPTYLKVASAAIERVAAATDKPTVVFGHIHSTVSREEAARLRSARHSRADGNTDGTQGNDPFHRMACAAGRPRRASPRGSLPACDRPRGGKGLARAPGGPARRGPLTGGCGTVSCVVHTGCRWQTAPSRIRRTRRQRKRRRGGSDTLSC